MGCPTKLQRAPSASSSVEAFFLAEGRVHTGAVEGDSPATPFDYSAFYRQFPFSIVLYDLDGRCIAANDAFQSQWGFTVDQVPSSYSVLRDAQLEAAGVMPLIQRAFAGELVVLPPVQYDSGVLLNVPAKPKWFGGTMAPIFDTDHNLVRVMLMHTDFFQQVQPQLAQQLQGGPNSSRVREIQLGNLDFYALYEQLPFSAAVFDTEGRMLMANLAFTREWGITIDQLPAGYSILRDAQLAAAGALPLVQRAFAGEPMELAPLRYDIGTLIKGVDSVRWIRNVFHPVLDDMGIVRQIVALHTDVTEQVQANLIMDAKSADDDRRLREILECTTDCVIHVDRNWTYTYLNKPALQMVSVGRELLGKNMWEEFPEAVNGKMWATYQKTMHERVPGETEEFYGEPLNMWLHVRAFPTAEGIAIFFQDITETRRTEQALRDNEKLAVLGRLAATIAHEIKNPLECVADLLYLLQSELHMPPEALRYVTLAQQELQRVSLISINTLKFVRQPAQPLRGSLIEVTDSVLTLFQGRIKLSGVRILTRYRAHADFVCYCDELRQVLVNFIGNALDATPTGASLHLRIRPTANANPGEPGVLVTIADTGTGMSAHTMAHLYEAFFTTKEVTGTGLGLWVSAEIIEKHNGRVRVRSRLASPACDAPSAPSGTVFQLAFPYRNNFVVEGPPNGTGWH